MSERDYNRQRVTHLPHEITFKWSPEVLLEGFTPFPKRFLRALPELFGKNEEFEELAVLMSIADYKRPNTTRFPSLEYLAFIAGLDEKVFKEALKRVKGKGWITLKRKGTQGIDIDMGGLLDKICEAAPEEEIEEEDDPFSDLLDD